MGYQIEGARASASAVREALVAPHCCFILAINALDEGALSSQERLEEYTGPQHVERSVRFLRDPRLLASSLYLNKPDRIMALLMVMTVCLPGYAALEYRLRTALKTYQATFPNQTGHPIQNPMARWVFQYFVGIHLLCLPGEGPLVLNLTDEHQPSSNSSVDPTKRFLHDNESSSAECRVCSKS
jgi:hypothetical protein